MTKLGNILLVSNYPSDTAYAWWLMEHFWRLLGSHFEANGARAFVAFPSITTISPALKSTNIEPVELSLPFLSIRQAFSAFQFFRKHNIKHIYFTDQDFFSVQHLFLRLAGVSRIVVHDHTPGDRPAIGGIRGIVKALRNRLPFLNADYVFAVSELMRQRSLLNGRVAPHKCITVQNGIAPINRNMRNRQHLRATWNSDDKTVVIVTSGRAHPYKRFDFIIETAKHVHQQAPSLDLRFVLVGDGPAMVDLKTRVQKEKLESVVLMLGFRRDVHEILLASDIAFHAALGEGFSLSIIEYMSAGLAVLVPDIPSVSQAIDDGDTGILYDWQDPRSAVEKIVELANRPAERQRLGANAAEKAQKDFTLDRCTQAFNEAIAVAFTRTK